MAFPTLYWGTKGPAVTKLQSFLNQARGFGLREDGIFGQATFEAVKEFQRSTNSKVDGIVGAETWAALENALAMSLNITPADVQATTKPTTAPASSPPLVSDGEIIEFNYARPASIVAGGIALILLWKWLRNRQS